MAFACLEKLQAPERRPQTPHNPVRIASGLPVIRKLSGCHSNLMPSAHASGGGYGISTSLVSISSTYSSVYGKATVSVASRLVHCAVGTPAIFALPVIAEFESQNRSTLFPPTLERVLPALKSMLGNKAFTFKTPR